MKVNFIEISGVGVKKWGNKYSFSLITFYFDIEILFDAHMITFIKCGTIY